MPYCCTDHFIKSWHVYSVLLLFILSVNKVPHCISLPHKLPLPIILTAASRTIPTSPTTTNLFWRAVQFMNKSGDYCWKILMKLMFIVDQSFFYVDMLAVFTTFHYWPICFLKSVLRNKRMKRDHSQTHCFTFGYWFFFFFFVVVGLNLSISVAQGFHKCYFDVYFETFFQNNHTLSLSFHDNSTATHPLIQGVRKSRDQYALVCWKRPHSSGENMIKKGSTFASPVNQSIMCLVKCVHL